MNLKLKNYNITILFSFFPSLNESKKLSLKQFNSHNIIPNANKPYKISFTNIMFAATIKNHEENIN